VPLQLGTRDGCYLQQLRFTGAVPGLQGYALEDDLKIAGEGRGVGIRLEVAFFDYALQASFERRENFGPKRCDMFGDYTGLLKEIRARGKQDVLAARAVLELVGNSTVVDSLKMVRRHGRLCLAGFLGGLGPIQDFMPVMQLPSGVHFSFFGSFMFGAPAFPTSEIPMQAIVERIENGTYKAKPARVFRFEEIRDAHRLMESGAANGKIVVCF